MTPTDIATAILGAVSIILTVAIIEYYSNKED